MAKRVERRLAAIMAADVVGYSRLVEADELGTLAAFDTIRTTIIDPLLVAHNGRVVKLMGDGILSEFGSAVDAVACAATLQMDVARSQAGREPYLRMVFRIGVNIGDVVVDEDDLLGVGVIVASRLEQLCEPGGILISGTVYDQLSKRIDFPIEYAGEQKVKGVSTSIRTYRVRITNTRVWRIDWRMISIPGIILIFIVAAGMFWWIPISRNGSSPSKKFVERGVYIRNDAGKTLIDFFGAPMGERQQTDFLVENPIPSGTFRQLAINDGFEACLYGFRAVFADGTAVKRWNVNICKPSTFRFRRDGVSVNER